MSTGKERARRVAHSTKEFFVGGRRFCCCIPTRIGVIIGSFLTFLVSGALAIILWFEVSTEHDMSFSSQERTYVILGGLLETFLCLVSVLGFIGAIVRKQLFVSIFAYFLLVHFLLNLGFGIYLLVVVNHTANVDVSVACHKAIKDPGAQQDCSKLLNGFRGALDGIIIFVLLIELYGLLIVTRYMRQLRGEKRAATFTKDEFRLNTHYYARVEDNDAEDSPFDSTYHPRPLSYASATHFPVTPKGFIPPSPSFRDPQGKEEKYMSQAA
ncbi:hypothetical protein BDY19DRAFT_967303 [Irpex rosettiformis]|uniref:Uncharacterized protein n=1 Tax=Irpex rosettiformis TaxID=378272 RepID=A0ACB8TSY6_9APHY|nr:hypothetical protein BDY19DRAFT_967303 [Irpex rosettiformis]